MRFRLFQLTRLMRGVTRSLTSVKAILTISTHTPHARRDLQAWFDTLEGIISTHTPHARRDPQSIAKSQPVAVISTHTPHARRDKVQDFIRAGISRFQLTRLMRGVTDCTTYSVAAISISTHTPHARRDNSVQDLQG